jgi:plastocyanin
MRGVSRRAHGRRAGGAAADGHRRPRLHDHPTQGGKRVTALKAGTYTIKVADKSNIHNFHLSGPGVNKTTSVPGTGTSTWTVKLKQGTYRYVCDPHASIMKGSFRVS